MVQFFILNKGKFKNIRSQKVAFLIFDNQNTANDLFMPD